MRFRAIGFDYYGVIYGRTSGIFEKYMSGYFEVSVDRFREVYHASACHGKAMWYDIAMQLNCAKKVHGIDDLLVQWKKEQYVNKEVIDLIVKLRVQGYKIGLLSNYRGNLHARLREQKIRDLFDVVCTSAEIGATKPDPKAFWYLCDALCVQPTEMIFVDDTQKNMETAERVGFKPIVFQDPQSLRKQLCECGVCV